MLARDRRREKENPLRIRPIPKRTPAHQQHVPQQHQEENDVGTCTLHYQEIEKSSRDHRRNKKSRTGTVPQAECMYQQERIHPAKRTNQTCRHRRTEQLHPARVPAPPRNGKVNGLCATRKRHSKRNLGGQAQRHRDIEINLKRISVPLYFRVHPPQNNKTTNNGKINRTPTLHAVVRLLQRPTAAEKRIYRQRRNKIQRTRQYRASSDTGSRK